MDFRVEVLHRQNVIKRNIKYIFFKVPSDGQPPQSVGQSRVAAVGPYIQSSTMPRGPARHELLKPTYPDGTATLPPQDRGTGMVSAPGKPDKGTVHGKHPKHFAGSGPLP